MEYMEPIDKTQKKSEESRQKDVHASVADYSGGNSSCNSKKSPFLVIKVIISSF
jgi:hypothetical protein